MAVLKVSNDIDSRVTAALERLANLDADALLEDIGEGMLLTTEARFEAERDPDGQPWEPLKPATRKRKRNPRILTESARLRGRIVREIRGGKLYIGTNLKYAPIHQFGGKIEKPERQTTLYFRQSKTGEVGNRFVKKRKSNFAQEATIGAHEFEMPARPYLGVSAEDRERILEALAAAVDAALTDPKP